MESRVPVTIFKIDGKLNASDSLFHEAKIAFEGGSRHMLFDLTDVPYISSAGFKAFHEIQNLLQNNAPESSPAQNGTENATTFSRHIKLLNPSDLVSEVLTVLGFDQYLEVHTDLEEAVKSF
jgi:anti-anti-sigma regulatory factor